MNPYEPIIHFQLLTPDHFFFLIYTPSPTFNPPQLDWGKFQTSHHFIHKHFGTDLRISTLKKKNDNTIITPKKINNSLLFLNMQCLISPISHKCFLQDPDKIHRLQSVDVFNVSVTWSFMEKTLELLVHLSHNYMGSLSHQGHLRSPSLH